MLPKADRCRKINKESDTIVNVVLAARDLYVSGVPKDVVIESFNMSQEQVIAFNLLIDKG